MSRVSDDVVQELIENDGCRNPINSTGIVRLAPSTCRTLGRGVADLERLAKQTSSLLTTVASTVTGGVREAGRTVPVKGTGGTRAKRTKEKT